MELRRLIFIALAVFLGTVLCAVPILQNQCQQARVQCAKNCTKFAVSGQDLSPGFCPSVPIGRPVGSSPLLCNVCQSGQFCDVGTGQCIPNTVLEITNRFCNVDEDCNSYVPDYLSPDYICFSSAFCKVAPKQNNYNDACTINADCRGSMHCVSGFCNTSISGACSDNRECPVNAACISNLCTPISFSGSCVASPDACFPTQVCNPITNVCINAFSLANGVSCSGSSKIEQLGCPNGALCTQVSPSSMSKTCENYFAVNSTGCNTLAQVYCDTQRICGCNDYVGLGTCFNQSQANQCQQQWGALLRCSENFNCRWEDMRAYNGTCLNTNCLVPFSNLIACTQTLNPEFPESQCQVSGSIIAYLNALNGAASALESIFW